jgi:hypothetical protein
MPGCSPLVRKYVRRSPGVNKRSNQLGWLLRAGTIKIQEMQLNRTGKSQYSETEAAEELGVSVIQLRTMIRSHVVDRDEDLGNVPATTFQPSDLLILRLLAGKAPVALE